MLARLIILTFITLGTPQLVAAQVASAQDYRAAVTLAKDVCITTFPNFTLAAPKLTAAGFDDRGKYGWVKGNLNIHAGYAGSTKNQICSISLRLRSKTTGMSDALQASLISLPVKITSARRKGMRLTVDFAKRGTDGRMLVDTLGGVSSRIVIRVEP